MWRSHAGLDAFWETRESFQIRTKLLSNWIGYLGFSLHWSWLEFLFVRVRFIQDLEEETLPSVWHSHCGSDWVHCLKNSHSADTHTVVCLFCDEAKTPLSNYTCSVGELPIFSSISVLMWIEVNVGNTWCICILVWHKKGVLHCLRTQGIRTAAHVPVGAKLLS